MSDEAIKQALLTMQEQTSAACATTAFEEHGRIDRASPEVLVRLFDETAGAAFMLGLTVGIEAGATDEGPALRSYIVREVLGDNQEASRDFAMTVAELLAAARAS